MAFRRLKQSFELDFLNAMHEEANASCYHTLVVSSEAFYGQCLTSSSVEKVRKLTRQVCNQASILFNCCDQPEFAKSFYAQLVHGPVTHHRTLQRYMESISLESEFSFHKRLEMWGRHFSYENVFIGQAPDCLRGPALLEDFMEKN